MRPARQSRSSRFLGRSACKVRRPPGKERVAKGSTRDWALFVTVALVVVVVFAALALQGRGRTSTTANSSPSPATGVEASPTPNSRPTSSPTTASTPAATATLPTQTYPGTLLITYISEPDRNYDVCLVRSDGTGFRRLTHGSGNEEHAYWSPDGTRIVYSGSGVWVMNADGSGKVRVGEGGSPCWSPDGKQILFDDGGVMNADGSDRRSLGLPLSSRYATWAPNGMIVFVSGYGGGDTSDRYPGGDLYAVHPDGTGLVRLTRHAGMILPSVSPDGTTIAAYVPKMDRIIAVPYRAYGPAVTLLAGASRYFPNGGMPIAHWTSDGKKLVLGSSNYGESGGAGLYVVDADGSGLTRVPHVTQAISPDWRPAAASPRPAVSYAEPPEPPAKAITAGTVGWVFKPTVDIEVTELGCYDADQDGLALSHRVGIFDPRTKRLLAGVTVRPRSTLDGAFRWESLKAPVVLRARQSYLVGTADRRQVVRNNTNTCETLYDGAGKGQWAPEIAFGGLRTSYRLGSGPEFTAPTDPRQVNAFIQIAWMSPNLKFVPLSVASATP